MAKKKVEVVKEYLNDIFNCRLDLEYTSEEMKRKMSIITKVIFHVLLPRQVIMG